MNASAGRELGAISMEVAAGGTAWLCATDRPEARQTDALMHRLLDDRERDRAARFRLEVDRCAYVLAHALQRMVLGETLGTHPAALVFEPDAHGRPLLRVPQAPGLFFSLAHARRGVAFAIATAPVGIDIESEEIQNLDLALIQSFLEMDDPTLPGSPLDFATRWTALEAFWKARGTGLVDGQPRLRLTARGANALAAHLCSGRGHWEEVAGISMLRALPGCVVAMAVLPGSVSS